MSADTLFLELTTLSISVSATLCVLTVFHRSPKKEALKPYRSSRWAILASYLLVTVLNMVEVVFGDPYQKHQLVLLDTLFVSSIQFFFFSATLTIILHNRSYDIRKMLRMVVPVVLLSMVGYMAMLTDHTKLLDVVFVALGLVYLFLVYRCTSDYLKAKRYMSSRMDNYYSEDSALRLKWTGNAFFLLFLGSIFSFLSLFLDVWFSIFFTVFYTFFYLYFIINYLNYITLFLELEAVLSFPEENETREKVGHRNTKQLDAQLKEWEQKKLFVEPGITIEQVAAQLNSNRTYLSSHMNVQRGVSFKEWISMLRIAEAKQLMVDHPELPVSQIGTMVGIPDKSNFGRQFTRLEGKSPQAWRKSQRNQPLSKR